MKTDESAAGIGQRGMARMLVQAGFAKADDVYMLTLPLLLLVEVVTLMVLPNLVRATVVGALMSAAAVALFAWLSLRKIPQWGKAVDAIRSAGLPRGTSAT